MVVAVALQVVVEAVAVVQPDALCLPLLSDSSIS